jgi:uncharacterized damage-inducible protein DinB
MNVDYFRRLFSYTDWANGKFLETVRGLTEEQLTRHIPSSFPTIRDTLAHMAFAEWLWLRRWKGENPSSRPDWTKEPSLDVIETHFREVAEERSQHLAALTDDDVSRDFPYRNMAGEPYTAMLGEQMTHVVNHGTYHRGQLTTMLRQVGATPPSTDLVNLFVAAHK